MCVFPLEKNEMNLVHMHYYQFSQIGIKISTKYNIICLRDTQKVIFDGRTTLMRGMIEHPESIIKKNNYFSMISKEMDKIALQRDVEGIKIGKMVEKKQRYGGQIQGKENKKIIKIILRFWEVFQIEHGKAFNIYGTIYTPEKLL